MLIVAAVAALVSSEPQHVGAGVEEQSARHLVGAHHEHGAELHLVQVGQPDLEVLTLGQVPTFHLGAALRERQLLTLLVQCAWQGLLLTSADQPALVLADVDEDL